MPFIIKGREAMTDTQSTPPVQEADKDRVKTILAKPYHRMVCPDEDVYLAQMLEFPGSECLAELGVNVCGSTGNLGRSRRIVADE